MQMSKKARIQNELTNFWCEEVERFEPDEQQNCASCRAASAIIRVRSKVQNREQHQRQILQRDSNQFIPKQVEAVGLRKTAGQSSCHVIEVKSILRILNCTKNTFVQILQIHQANTDFIAWVPDFEHNKFRSRDPRVFAPIAALVGIMHGHVFAHRPQRDEKSTIC